MSIFFNENPLVVNSELARLLGLNESIILQQIHYWIEINRKTQKNFYDGHTWVFNTYQGWCEQFPFWSTDTIKRTILKLEKAGILISGNYNKLKVDRTKWYRIDYEKIKKAQYDAIGQNALMDGASCPHTSGQSAPTNNQRLPKTTTEIKEEEESKISEKQIEQNLGEDLNMNYCEEESLAAEESSTGNESLAEHKTSSSISNKSEDLIPKRGLDENGEDLVEMVKKKLGVDDTLALLVAARCQDREFLEKVIDQLTNAKKPIRNMTAYLLTLIANPNKWDLFIENVENEFLTRERPKKKKREVKPKHLGEEREIYIPPLMG